MKILHTADWHLGAYVGPQCDDPLKRMGNTIKCLDVLVQTAEGELPDIILIAGDIFHTAKVWSDRSNVELRTAANYINQLAEIAPTVVLYGTPNHDNSEQFFTLEKLTEAIFICDPKIETIQTMSGPIQVAGLPGFDKGFFRSQHPGLSAEEENRIFTEQLDSIVQGLSAQINPNIPSVLMAHHTVVGCELDNGQHVFQANEVVLSTATLENSAFDMVCLGHIHKAQKVECLKPVYYAGSIDAFTFNDERQTKGFYLYNLDKKTDGKAVVFVSGEETPAREFRTCTWDEDSLNTYFCSGIYGFANFEAIKNKVIRVLYSCDKATEKALDKKKLERDLYAAGSYYVAEIRPEKITAEVNRDKLHEKLTVWECLKKYLVEKFKATYAEEILTEAEPIVSEVEASTVAGTQTGMFLPLEIEVRNYRSYKEEKLSFEELFFCMVNGKNGSGKSSLVMDATVDCLYEEPREGELTGWIKSGEKSGSISFTFQLGTDTYRVTRTRQRSGKATLSLNRKLLIFSDYGEGIPGSSSIEWEDCSCQKLVDTQEKIVQLLGMDVNTFRSCVLIMQDQYGRFMEAKSEDRMSVLASLLGLGIYEQLEDKTKKLLTDINRELKQSKDEIFVLEQDISTLKELQNQKADTEGKLKYEQDNLNTLKKEHVAISEKVTMYNTNKIKLDEMTAEIFRKNLAIHEGSKKLEDLSTRVSNTKEFLKGETFYIERYNELTQLRNQITAMDGTKKLMEDKKKQLDKLIREGSLNEQNIKKYKSELDDINSRLNQYYILQVELTNFDGVEVELKFQEEKKTRKNELSREIIRVSGELHKIDSNIRLYEQQTAILKNSNCIDIDNAQCGFLKNAKEAEVKLKELLQTKHMTTNELTVLESQVDELAYDPIYHETVRNNADRAYRIKQKLAILDGEKKSAEMYTKQIAEFESSAAELLSQRNSIRDEIAEIAPKVSDTPYLETRIAGLQQYENSLIDIANAKAFVEATEPQINDIELAIGELIADKSILEEKNSLLQIDIEACQKHAVKLDELTAKIIGCENNISEFNRIIGGLDEKIRILVDKSIELQKKHDAIKLLADKSARLQVLSEAFSQDGIPHQIVRDIVPDLEESANEILSQMTGGRMSLEFKTERTLKSNKDKEIPVLDVMITDMDNGELPYLSRSGGQKTRCSLSVIFALAILKASRMGLQLGMLFIDEPAGLDEEGIDGYCTALETIHNLYPDMRIVAISHDERMKARFAQHLFVEITENGSKVKKG